VYRSIGDRKNTRVDSPTAEMIDRGEVVEANDRTPKSANVGKGP